MNRRIFAGLGKALPYLKNRYVITFLSFMIWLSFFDRNDFLTIYSYRQKLNKLRAEKQYYEEEIMKNKVSLNNLMTDRENLEKYGRERYLMKRKDEDIFVIVDMNEKNAAVK